MSSADFTVREAAMLAGVRKSVVEKAIETKVARPVKRRAARRGGGTRYLPLSAVAYFSALERSGLSASLALSHKRRLWAAIAKAKEPKLSSVELAPGTRIDVKTLTADRLREARRYRKARDRHIVASDLILGGTPVIRGTRMTVYSVLGRVQGGDTVDDILSENPDLSRDALEAAVLYARAHPLRGKPGGRPWRNAT